MNIVVTGSSAHLARPLLARLFNHPEVTGVTGLDVRPGGLRHWKFQEHRVDVRDPNLGDYLQGADALIHMAFVVMRASLGRRHRDRELVRDINVGGSTNVFSQAREAGIRSLVHLSSASVYGAWPDNPAAMDETQPRRGIPSFAYAEDKVAVEAWLDGFERDNPQIRLVRLRPHVILGPYAQPFLKKLLNQPICPRLADPQPRVQCVWEDDVVEAIIKATFGDVRGGYNLAADPPLSFKHLLQLSNRRVITVPLPLLSLAHKALWRFSGALEEPGWLQGMRYSLVVDSTKAQRELGWQPTLSTQDCVLRLSGGGHGRGDSV